MNKLFKPIVFIAAASVLPSLHNKYSCNAPMHPFVPGEEEKKWTIIKVRRDTRMKDPNFSYFDLIKMVIKRYYRGIMRASMKAWLDFFIENKLYILSILFLIFA